MPLRALRRISPSSRGMRPRGELEKSATMRRNIRRDAVDPRIVLLASRLARPFAPDDWLAIARTIFAFVRDGIRYQHDPDRREELASSGEILDRGWDDCDGKIRLGVSLMRSLGMDADQVDVWRGPVLSHVMMRVRFPGSRKIAGADRDGYLYGDLTIRGAQLGQNPHAIGSNPDTGALPLSGGPPPRYYRGT